MSGKFLVVDDEKSLRFTFMKFLEAAGHAAETAVDYDEALSKVSEGDYDVIITDILLGGKTGIDLLRELRRKEVLCPVVMVTGFPNVETASEAVRLGAFDYLTKPVVKESLLAVATDALSHKASEEQELKHRENLEAIFDNVSDGIVTVDADGNILEVNDVAKALCGFGEQCIGEPFAAQVTRCSGRCLESLKKNLGSGQEAGTPRLECLHAERPSQVVSVASSPLLGKTGTFVGAMLVLKGDVGKRDHKWDFSRPTGLHKIVGKSKPMQHLYALLKDLAAVPTTTLIVGESGTGKELVAEALHYLGPRKSNPLVKVNCAALPDTLLESELFGHVRGAFTGALKDRAGRLQMADGGTLFLDEIGDISPGMQLRLLRVLQEKEFERVGSSATIKVDVRIVAATNKDLEKKVRLGEFREDLYYRLKIVPVQIPPLRERRDDIPLLVEHFTDRFNRQFGRDIVGASPEVLESLKGYSWPGNIRELQHVLEYAFVRCHKKVIAEEHLPEDIRKAVKQTLTSVDTDAEELERIEAALKKTDFNKAKAARLLGIDRKTLYRKMEKYKIPLEGA